MNAEDFVAWSLDPARTVEERYTIELLCDIGRNWYNSRHKINERRTLEQTMALNRERELNPAYVPHFTEEDVRKAAWCTSIIHTWTGDSHRPVRSLAPLRFFTALESLSLPFDEPADLTPLIHLPLLRTLTIGHPGSAKGTKECHDYTPLARCTALRTLNLSFAAHWPDLTGVATLDKLETLTLAGNLLAMPPGAVFPNVRRAVVHCLPLAARSVGDLPGLPACEFLTLSGVEKLDGIERMPYLRNLTLGGAFKSFEPLTVLRELTCLTVGRDLKHHIAGQPLDVSPLARLPRLHFFQIGSDLGTLDQPRDYSPLAEAPALRELKVLACPPVEMEVAAINAGLLPWGDVLRLEPPRPLPPLRMIVAPLNQMPKRLEEPEEGVESGLPDAGLRECEGRWVEQYVQDFITRRIGYEEWGTTDAKGDRRGVTATVESFDVVERLPEIVDALCGAMAGLRDVYRGQVWVDLKAKPPEATPAQKEMEAQFRARQDDWEQEQRERDRADYIERLHQMELKQQQGEPIEAEDFSPNERDPYPVPPWEEEDDEDEEDEETDFSGGDGDGGGAKVKEKPDPPPSWLDDAHPLADQYRLMAWVTLEEIWFMPHQRGIACHLMQREPDVEIPDDGPIDA